jgi:PKD repeat protein
MTTGRATYALLFALASFAGAAGCTLSSDSPPAFTGPSEFALSLAVSASPDVLPENGASQSTIGIVARDSNGQPAPNVSLRVETVNDQGQITQVGSLSTSSVTTDSQGRASVMFTAPFADVVGVENTTPVKIRVTPTGTDRTGLTGHFVTIRLVPPSVVSVPGSPVARFSANPASPSINQVAIFDASNSFDPDGSIVRYDWNWGDGTTDEGVLENHDWSAAGTYNVKLTVTDNSGLQSFVIRQIVVN